MKNSLKESAAEDLKNVAKIIEDVGVCMLNTTDHAGRVSTRPMYVQEVDQDAALWFFTSSKAALIQEINTNPLVSLTFADSKKNEFLAATAVAYQVFDRDKIEELWSPAMKVWFKDGVETPELTLLKIDLQEIEYWDAPESTVVKIAGLIQTLTTDKPFRPGRHEKVDLSHKM